MLPIRNMSNATPRAGTSAVRAMYFVISQTELQNACVWTRLLLIGSEPEALPVWPLTAMLYIAPSYSMFKNHTGISA